MTTKCICYESYVKYCTNVLHDHKASIMDGYMQYPSDGNTFYREDGYISFTKKIISWNFTILV
jgi:hypothetical protein